MIAGAWITPSTQVRDLGVIIDNDLTLTAHVSKLASTCYFHIRQIRLIRRSLDVDATHALVRALIHSRLDYCNGVLANLPITHMKRLQSVLRSAARVVLRLPSHASITDLMKSKLHWLGFPHRIQYKLCVLTYKCLHGMAPAYLTRKCTSVAAASGRSQLRSASSGQLVVPFTKTKTFGDRSFSHSAPSFWNSLSTTLRANDLSLAVFKNKLKTYLFARQ